MGSKREIDQEVTPIGVLPDPLPAEKSRVDHPTSNAETGVCNESSKETHGKNSQEKESRACQTSEVGPEGEGSFRNLPAVHGGLRGRLPRSPRGA